MRLSHAISHRVAGIAFLFIGSALTGSMAKADTVIVSNLTATFQDNQGPLTTSNWFGNVFTNTSAIDVSKITLFMSGPSATAALYSDNAGAPGTNLGTFTFSGSNVDAFDHGTYDFTPSSTISLAANTNYWVVSSGLPATSDTYWDFTNDSTPNIGVGAFSPNAGGSWGNLGYTFKFEVDGINGVAASTPEPGTWGLMCGLGVMGSSILVRRRKRK